MNINLIEVNLNHIEDYYKIFSSTNVCRYMDLDKFSTIEDAKRFIENALIQKENLTSFRYSIQFNNMVVGSICLYSIYWHQKRCSVGYAINENFWNLGITKKSLTEIEKIAKNNYSINRIQATVLPENIISKKVLINSSFEYEGTLKQYEIWGSKGFVDLEIYAKIVK